MSDRLFGNIEKKTGVKMDDVMKLANSLQGADLQDEKTVRDLVKRVGRLANKPVSKQTEDSIVEALTKKNVKPDMSMISKMMDGNNKKR